MSSTKKRLLRPVGTPRLADGPRRVPRVRGRPLPVFLGDAEDFAEETPPENRSSAARRAPAGSNRAGVVPLGDPAEALRGDPRACFSRFVCLRAAFIAIFRPRGHFAADPERPLDVARAAGFPAPEPGEIFGVSVPFSRGEEESPRRRGVPRSERP